jgi:hypothetical protein
MIILNPNLFNSYIEIESVSIFILDKCCYVNSRSYFRNKSKNMFIPFFMIFLENFLKKFSLSTYEFGIIIIKG